MHANTPPPPNCTITVTKLWACEKVKMFLPGIWCTGGRGDPLGKYKSGNWDLEALNLGSAFDRDLRWISVLLVFRGGYVSRSPEQEHLPAVPGSDALLILLLCPPTPPGTLTSRPCGVGVKATDSRYLGSNARPLSHWPWRGLCDLVSFSVKWGLTHYLPHRVVVRIKWLMCVSCLD